MFELRSVRYTRHALDCAGPALQKMCFEVQPSSTACNTDTDRGTVPLLMPMPHLSCMLYWSHQCKAQTDVNFQSGRRACCQRGAFLSLFDVS